MTGKDANNNSYNTARAYIPNSERRTLNLLFKEFLPSLCGRTICQKIQLVVTDRYTSEYVSFIQNCGFDKNFQSAEIPSIQAR